jgi:hypothetical protein
MSEKLDDVKKEEYLKILLQQYSESWQSIRECSNAVWQIPMLLITSISVLGIAYAQPSLYQNQIARILILLLGFGFTLVSLLALIKHRFLSDRRVDDFENIQGQLRTLLNQKEFREIKFKSKELAEGRCSIYHTSAYKWQRDLTVIILFGIAFLLAREFVLVVIHS